MTPIGHQVKGEESQTAEVVNVEALLPQDRDYLTYQVDFFTWTSKIIFRAPSPLMGLLRA